MAIASTANNARCQDCGAVFFDPTGQAPCPNCRSVAIIDLPAKPQSQPAKEGKQTSSTPAKQASAGFPLYLFAALFGAGFWLEGARTTRDGWIVALNWILGRLHIPHPIPDVSQWAWQVALGAQIGLGLGYSLVEIRYAPFRLPSDIRKNLFNRKAWYFNRSWQAWLTWIFIIFTDVVTMYLGARAAGPDDPAILRQIAAARIASWIYAIIITFIPDRLVRFGWKGMRGR